MLWKAEEIQCLEVKYQCLNLVAPLLAECPWECQPLGVSLSLSLHKGERGLVDNLTVL